ncbi:MAG: hypothetical protein ACJ73N_14095 [Bryobacteraceae bacterium]
MLPLTMLTAQKVSDLFTKGSALQQEITALNKFCNANVPPIDVTQIILSSASQDMSDRDIQSTYPRICLYSAGIKNTQAEKFRSLSGSLAAVADIWTSGNLLSDIDQWIHFYVEALTNILRKSIGDWGDGIFFPGAYDVQFQSPKVGGLGFVQVARITFNLNVSRN